MRIDYFIESLWPCLGATLRYLTEKRNELSLEHTVRAGMNFSIVLGSACFVEGVLEAQLRAMLEARRSEFSRVKVPELELRRAVNLYQNRLTEDLQERISRAQGAQGYDELVELLIGEQLSQLKQVAPLWEGITVLFNFRNVLAHGREISARQFHGGAVPNGFKEEFTGGYRKVQDYLQKKGLLTSKFVEAHDEYLFFTDAVADHFRELAESIPNAVANSLPEPERRACLEPLKRRVW